MANFTTEVRSICETLSGLSESKGYDSIADIIENSRTRIFDFDYPIFDEEYRAVLETKILKHYYTREICAETYGRWKLFLDARMNEIMPYYNKLYESELLQYNPLMDVDYTRSGETENNQTKSESGTTTSGFTEDTTGNVTDSGEVHNTESITGTVTDAKTGTESDNGTVQSTLAKTGTVKLEKDTTDQKTKTGTERDDSENSSTRTDNLTQTSNDGGSDQKSGTSAPKKTTWDYFHDTPQGRIYHDQNKDDLADYEYLTNARNIIEDGTGSTSSDTTTYGKTNQTKNTGTVGTTGTGENVKTYNTTDSVVGTDDETTTFDTLDTTAETDTNTKTFNTTVTRTHNTTDQTDTRTAGLKQSTGRRSSSGNGSSSSSFTGNNTGEYVEHIVGKRSDKSYMQLIQELRDTFLNIDLLIIRDLNDLFFTIYE